ncbi:MAG TPA: ribosomal protein S18-alanine N-acetyltransferase [Limnochordales bacterium]
MDGQEPLPIVIEPMRVADIDMVMEIERRSFPTPWSRAAFVSELLDNDRAHYFVARATTDNGPLVVGYIGLWLIAGEGHITNVAVHPDYRQRGIGRRLLEAAAELCRARSARRMTLEVRVSNLVAQRLYRDMGFVSAGIRRGYYRDNNEDAIIMWKDL